MTQETSRARPDSIASQIASLEVGQAWSRVEWLDESNSLEAIRDGATEMKQTLRNAVTASVRNARQRTGYTYRIEVCQGLTDAGRMYLLAIATREE